MDQEEKKDRKKKPSLAELQRRAERLNEDLKKTGGADLISSPTRAVNSYKNNNSRVVGAVTDLDTLHPSLQQLQLLVGRKALKEFGGEKIRDQRAYAEAVLIDQFGWDSFKSIIKQYGPKVLDFASNLAFRTEPGAIEKHFGSYNAGKPQKVIRTQSSVPESTSSGGYGVNDVNPAVLKSFVCPGEYAARRIESGATGRRTAICAATEIYTLTVNSAGSGEFWLFPEFPTMAGNTTNKEGFIIMRSGSDFNAGSGSGTATYANGPLQTNLTAISAYRMSAFEITVSCSASMMNNSGTVCVLYSTNTYNSTFSSATNGPPVLSLGDMQSNAFFQTGNSLTKYYSRRIPLSSDVMNYSIPSFYPIDQFFLVRVFGASASAIYTITAKFVYELIPSSSYLKLMHIDQPLPGTATESLYNNLVNRFPGIQSCDAIACHAIVAKLSSLTTNDHDSIMAKAVAMFGEYSNHQYSGTAHFSGPSASVMDMSFEQRMQQGDPDA